MLALFHKTDTKKNSQIVVETIINEAITRNGLAERGDRMEEPHIQAIMYSMALVISEMVLQELPTYSKDAQMERVLGCCHNHVETCAYSFRRMSILEDEETTLAEIQAHNQKL